MNWIYNLAMSFIADLHIHSKYSRACSKNLDLPNINAWAQIKGIDLVATADYTYPAWFKELSEQLEEVDNGVYGLKKEYRLSSLRRQGSEPAGIDSRLRGNDIGGRGNDIEVPESCRREIRFILSTEISLIYKKNERTRKVHLVVLAPSLSVVAKINKELDKRGNIKSDGRPILGLDSKELLKILLSISPDIELIPAHAWTPHFAIFGSASGFDSVEECFDELAPNIHALETGLSSDPPMNWRLSQLDKYVLVSSSDAHSPAKLGREATIFDCEMTYPAILHALRHDHSAVAGTIEFFPEEGKYHADGLRKEDLCCAPEQTREWGGVSPKTGKKITVGVLSRVASLADRPASGRPETARPFWSIIPLTEVIGEVLDVGPASKKVDELYWRLISELGPEFYILKDAPVADIARVHELAGEAVARMRAKNVILYPGYDGEYGAVKLFNPGELVSKKQMKLF